MEKVDSSNPKSKWKIPNSKLKLIFTYSITLFLIVLAAVCLRYNLELIRKFMTVYDENDDDDDGKCPKFSPHLYSLTPKDPLLINYVKCHHLTPPSLEPYNLTAKKDPSEYSRVLRQIFQFKRPGLFIECGANDGEFRSNTLALERDRGWTGLLIEVSPEPFKKLKTKHRRAWIADVCLSPDNKTNSIELKAPEKPKHEFERGTHFMKHKSFSPNGNYYSSSSNKFKSVGNFLCFPLVTILSALGMSRVDYFSLDIQGMELRVLKTLPFDNSLMINVIHASFDGSPEGPEQLETFMKSKGYRKFHRSNQDIIFIRNGFNMYG